MEFKNYTKQRYGNLSDFGLRFKQTSFWLVAAFGILGIGALGLRLLSGMTWLEDIPARFECTVFSCVFVAVSAVIFLTPIVVGMIAYLRRQE
jgi:hypothetical protein